MSRRALPSLRGVTLVEAMVAVAVLGIVLAVAVPSLLDMVHRRRIEGVANELASDLALMKVVSATQGQVNKLVYLQVGTGQAGMSASCYSMFVGDPGMEAVCDCMKPPGGACKSDDDEGLEVKTVKISGNSGIGLTIAGTRGLAYLDKGRDITPEPLRITVQGATGRGALRVNLVKGGLVGICSPSGNFSGYPVCPS